MIAILFVRWTDQSDEVLNITSKGRRDVTFATPLEKKKASRFEKVGMQSEDKKSTIVRLY